MSHVVPPVERQVVLEPKTMEWNENNIEFAYLHTSASVWSSSQALPAKTKGFNSQKISTQAERRWIIFCCGQTFWRFCFICLIHRMMVWSKWQNIISVQNCSLVNLSDHHQKLWLYTCFCLDKKYRRAAFSCWREFFIIIIFLLQILPSAELPCWVSRSSHGCIKAGFCSDVNDGGLPHSEASRVLQVLLPLAVPAA